MKKLLAIFVALAMLVAPVMADVATGSVGAGAAPGDQTPTICVKHRNVKIGYEADPVGINALDYRTSLYAFAGEQLIFDIVVRDANGAADIGPAKIRVEGAPEVLCTEITFDQLNGSSKTCDGLGNLTETTDKAFRCTLTVEPTWYGDSEVVITAYNSAFMPTDGTHTENWYFNPAISLSVTTNDGLPIHFEDGQPGDWVHSLNKMQVKNVAEGGVNMWMFIAGTDLTDPSGASLCPDSNVLRLHEGNEVEVEPNSADTGMAYRAWSGTQWTSWEGWVWMSKYDQNAACDPITMTMGLGDYTTCYGGRPVPFPNLNDDVPNQLENLLTNQGTMEIEFKLHYPVPCIGTFSEGTIYIFGKAV